MCERCWTSIAPAPSLLPSGDAITVVRAGGDFDGPLRNIIHAFKYEGRRSLAAPLARLMLAAAADTLTGADCIVPVPLHPWRHFRRGFNQASDLAGALGLPTVHALWRMRATAPQSGLTAAARQRNVRGAFRLSPLLSRAARDRALRDRIVVLVDDVRTTGATMNACATVLKEAGVREVRALTAAARS